MVVAEPSPDAVPAPGNPYTKTIEGVHKVSEIEPATLPMNFDADVVDRTVAVSVAGFGCGMDRGEIGRPVTSPGRRAPAPW